MDITNSIRCDDGFNRNPNSVLNSLIVYRKNLRAEVESKNMKITQIDQKITEVLQLLSFSANLDEQSPTDNRNKNKLNKKNNEFELEKLKMKKNYLDLHTTTHLRDESFVFGLNTNMNFTSSYLKEPPVILRLIFFFNSALIKFNYQ